MKFFSNDKDTDDPEYDRERHGDVVTSDPVAVPQQRAGSPWSDAPGSPETGTGDAPAGTTYADSGDTTHTDDLDTTRADNLDTTHADAETGSPDDELADRERRDGTDEEPASRRDETGTVTTYGPDGTVTESPAEPDGHIHADGHDDTDGHIHADAEPRSDVDIPLDEETHDDLNRRDVTDSAAGSGEARAEDAALLKDEGTFDSPEAVEPSTGEPLEGRTDDSAKERAEAEAEADETVEQERADERKAELDGQPVAIVPEPVAVAPADATPGSVPAPALDRLFSDSDSFAERFRDIQLRFVDSPKEATADAAALVGEAVDKLTEALRAQKDSLSGESDDTEQLRVQLRSYRDLLNRLSAL